MSVIRFESLEKLYARGESLRNSGAHGVGWTAHAAVLDRLAANQRVARALGWTSCAIERSGTGRFIACGVPPGDSGRHKIPDWAADAT
jgi:hypothetical protein